MAEAQRLNPSVRTAGLLMMKARALLGITGSALYPQLQQRSGEALPTGTKQAGSLNASFRSAGASGKSVLEGSIVRTGLFIGVALYAWVTVWALERWRAGGPRTVCAVNG